ncbi:UNVERIFIED_CONTAM: hypothetical protein Sradi_6422400 [Sesamum radiatum]|uniref:Uncharacterized protein n=1 Tax=Sesamum radiatum TaxID=300843 RepID=A0AAW2K3Z6_SESRA
MNLRLTTFLTNMWLTLTKRHALVVPIECIPLLSCICPIADRRDPVKVYIADCYKKDMYLKCYSHMIHAVPGKKEWVQTGCDPLMAPKIKKKRGRPTKARRKGPDELQGSISTRKGLTRRCQNCLELGHNKGTCTKPTHPQSKLKKVGAHEEMSSTSGPPNTQEDAVPSTQSSMSRNKHNVSTGANVTPTPCTVQISSKVQNDGRIYQSPRNATLMGATQTKFAPSTIEVGGSSSTPGAGLRKPTRQKKPTISQVLQNIREKSKRRPWKP